MLDIIRRLSYFSTDCVEFYERCTFTGYGRCYFGHFECDQIFRPHTSFYKGYWKDGYRHGQGQYVSHQSGFKYEGDFFEGYATGRGIEYAPDGKYIGQFYKGKRHGKGTLYTENGNDITAECEWNDGDRVIDFVLPGEQ
jgi:hypothetical protein